MVFGAAEVILVAKMTACAFAAHYVFGASMGQTWKSYQDSSSLKKHEYCNNIVACFFTGYASIMGFLGTYGPDANYPPPLSAVVGVTETCRILTLQMTAYLIYDFLCILISLSKKVEGERFDLNFSEMIFHHFLGILGICSCLCFDMGGNINMWVYIGEGSTPFMVTRLMMLSAGMKGSLAITVTEFFFAAAFFATRILSVPLCLQFLWSAQSQWPAAITWHFWYLFTTTLLFFGLNCVWFIRIVNMAKKALFGKETSIKKDE